MLQGVLILDELVKHAATFAPIVVDSLLGGVGLLLPNVFLILVWTQIKVILDRLNALRDMFRQHFVVILVAIEYFTLLPHLQMHV